MANAKRVSLCVNTQTPPVRFSLSYSDLLEKYDEELSSPVKLAELKAGADYDFSPGGVTAMVYPMVKRMMNNSLLSRTDWISLGPNAPTDVEMDSVTLHNISLEQRELARYTNFKEGIWNEIHGLGNFSFRPEDYEAYVTYNWLCAKLMLDMLRNVDIFWIHDFQQLYTGGLIGPSAPAILRWHIPFRLEEASPGLRTLIIKSIEGFDAITVSTRRDLEGLIRAGYRGKAQASYPYVEADEWNKVTPSSIEKVRSKFDLRSDDKILLVTARMDPVKSQDTAIRALAKIRHKVGNAKLVLAGNGSFTGSAKGGLGHPKSSRWRTYLEGMVRELKLEGSVVFTGHVNHEELDAFYSCCDAVLVPSKIEGFNLTAIEGWLHKKPCVVSNGAGVSELVLNDLNGYVFNPSDDKDLAERVESLLVHPDAAQKMGENGLASSAMCSVSAAISSVSQQFDEVSKTYASFDRKRA